MVRSLMSTLPLAAELALDPSPGLVVVRQHDGQVVDVDLAVAIGVAGQEGLDAAAVGVELDEIPPLTNWPA